MLNDVILNNRTLKKNILSLTDENNYLYDSLYDMEIQYNMNQYTRRSNREINNISQNYTTEPRIVCFKSYEIIGYKSCVL